MTFKDKACGDKGVLCIVVQLFVILLASIINNKNIIKRNGKVIRILLYYSLKSEILIVKLNLGRYRVCLETDAWKHVYFLTFSL